ncbi:Rha family transcriptional regulator [Paenibacillus larvae]|uniref:Putative phage anti-repressor n=1 Tax=Paenibacillus larvae subsp. larvae TaxID=147375 RepID=A0A6C0QRG4_9BACL|nr:Rha family transcriptional regulator [Paenibacillus larvae]QHZ51282.1 putative phage anti-repressor [Paenibacillus larvae subsp. larvae]
MNQLNVINRNGQLLVDSREVAEMTNARHSDLLERIEGYIKHLENGNFRSQDFFIQGSYKVVGNNKVYKCYLLTRKGCDMVANKMTGEKGVLFTAAYVSKFEEMESQLRQQVPTLSPNQAIAIALQQTAEMMNKLPEIEFKIENVERKLDTQITLDSGQQYRLQKAVRKKVCSIEPDKEARKPLFRQLNGEIRDRWGVPSVRDVLKTDFVDVIRYVDAWIPKKTVTVTPVINSLDDPSPSELGQKIEQQLKCDMEKMF